ncbi:MAG: DUF3304 domain-containing protein [Rubrivivax sp.]|nr:MAG: DUF3304 domain-containing protein [Rubrivivax sp.]
MMINIKFFGLILLLATLLGLGGCTREIDEQDASIAGIDKISDPYFDVISTASYNYTTYDIYDVFVLPPDKNDLKFAAPGHGNWALRKDQKKWELNGGGASLAWDPKWTLPKKFKIWWLRVVDKAIFTSSGPAYDKYTTKEARAGSAWCEGEILVQHGPRRNRKSYLIVHFFPDGHIEGDVDYSGEVVSRVDVTKRFELPVLRERACLKQIENPYFGKPKPIDMY